MRITDTSLLSCLLICSRIWSSPDETNTIRDTVGSRGSSLTVRDSILKPRLENRPATRAKTPNSFSTRTDIVCFGIVYVGIHNLPRAPPFNVRPRADGG